MFKFVYYKVKFLRNTQASLAVFAVFAVAVFLFFFFFPVAGHSYDGLPDKVKVGLYFASQKTGSLPLTSFSIRCASGVDIGYTGPDGVNAKIYGVTFANDSSKLELSKYYFNRRYSVALATTNASGLSGSLSAFDDLAAKGASPKLVFMGSWKILVGSFSSEKEAAAYMNGSFISRLQGYNAETVDLGGRYINISVDGKLQFIFDTSAGNINVQPAAGSGQPLYLNNKQYRGYIEALSLPQSDMTVINVLSMNEYLYGVVPREIEASSHAEALKAQAVAARTYAANSLGKHKDLGFDLCNTVDCQVYGAYEWEHENTSKAVDDTKGVIVTWQGKPALVFYFSSSGGHTEDVKNVWGSDYPYLVGVEDKYESGQSTRYRWEATFTARQLKERLAAAGVDVGDIKSVTATKMSKAGRVFELTITGTKGSQVYTNEKCRTFLKELNSQMYTVRASGGSTGTQVRASGASGNVFSLDLSGKRAAGAGGFVDLPKAGGLVFESQSGKAAYPASGTTFTFSGLGWGHGVGMSQEGAKGMALAGFMYDEILGHYFTGCEVG